MKKLLLFIAFAIFGLGLNAQNVGDVTTIDYDGYSLKFKVTSVEPAACRVSDCTGEPIGVTIPSTRPFAVIPGNILLFSILNVDAINSGCEKSVRASATGR